MQYWWVNQNSTSKEEVAGGYMWSPKKNRNGAKNEFYDNMTRVSCGDIVFSCYKTRIQHLGIVTSKGYTQGQPEEFGTAGEAWNSDGWKVDVQYYDLTSKLKPKDHIDLLRPLLPSRYSPLQATGGANQVYLANVPALMGKALLSLIGDEVERVLNESKRRQAGAGDSLPVVDLQRFNEQFEEQVRASGRDSDEKRQERLSNANDTPEKVKVSTTVYNRNKDVVAEVLKRANGICEKCKSPAPFKRAKDGTPYLEVHHWKLLAQGGKDRVDNAGALCPNCHREVHLG